MRKILVGVDLSPTAERAIGHAVDLARRDSAEVVLVLADIVPDVPEGVPESAERVLATYSRTLGERLAVDRRELERLFERWRGRGVAMSQLVVDGYPDDQLARVAQELDADLVVVGSHGRTGWKRVLLGSVAERVVRLAPCSVLVVRGDAPAGGYRKLVVGTDFSEIAERAIARALRVAAPGAHVELAHCFQLSPVLASEDAPAMAASYDELHADLLHELDTRGRALVDRLRAQRPDLELAFRVIERPPAHGLDDLARDLGADLVVVGSHGRRGVRRLLLGSVAEVTVRHAPCSTLVAR